MAWINNDRTQLAARDTNYNGIACLSKRNLDTATLSFNTLFGDIVDFTEEVSSIHMYPFSVVPILPQEGYASYLKTSRLDTFLVTAYYIDPDTKYMNFGQYKVEPYYNNFADYKGYTSIKVFLPFVGFVDVDVNECMGKYLQFRLSVDYFTGKGLFIIGVSDNPKDPVMYPSADFDFDVRVIASYNCDVGIEIPIGSSNAGEVKRNLLLGSLKVAAGVAASIATLNPAPAVTTATSVVEPTVKTYDVQGRSTAKGSRMKTIKSGTVTTEGGSKTTTTVHHKPINVVKPISDTVNASLDVLNNIHNSGNGDRTNDSGLMWNMSTNVQVVIYRPKFVTLDENYGALYGYPLGDTYELGDLRGYTEINAIHIEGAGFETITNKEVALLEEVFANGILL